MAVTAPAITVGRLGSSGVAAGAKLIARAYDHDALGRLILPDPERRRRYLEHGGRVQIQRALPHRQVFGAYEDDELRGIAVWLPPRVSIRASVMALPSALPRMAGTFVRAGPDLARLLRGHRRAVTTVDRMPSWYLAFIATDPDHQGRGIGRRLFRHILDRADEHASAAWVETSEPANVGLLERFGFATFARVGGGPALPTFWVMRRPPAG